MDQQPKTDKPKLSSNNGGNQESLCRQRWRSRGINVDPRQPLETISENGLRDQNKSPLEGCSTSKKEKSGRKRLSYNRKIIEFTPNNQNTAELSYSGTPLSALSYLQDTAKSKSPETPPFVLRKKLQMSENARNYLEKEFTELSEFTTQERQILSIEGLPEAMEENTFLKAKLEELVVKTSNLDTEVSTLKETVAAQNNDYAKLLDENQHVKTELETWKQRSVDYQVTIESNETKWVKREEELKKSLEEAWNLLAAKSENLLFSAPKSGSFNGSELPRVRRSLDNEETISGEMLVNLQYKIDELMKDNVHLKKAMQEKLCEIENLKSEHKKESAESDLLIKELESQLIELKGIISELKTHQISIGDCQNHHQKTYQSEETLHNGMMPFINQKDLLCDTIIETVSNDTTFQLINLDVTQTAQLNVVPSCDNKPSSNVHGCWDFMELENGREQSKSSNKEDLSPGLSLDPEYSNILERLKNEIDELNIKLQKCTQIISAKEEELNILEMKHYEAVDIYQKQISDLEAEIEKKANYVVSLEVETLKKEIKELNLQLEENGNNLTKQNEDLNLKLEDSKNIISGGDTVLDGLNSNNELKTEQAENTILLKDEIIALQKNHDVAVEEYQTITDALKTSLESKSNLVDPSEIENLTRKIEELNSQLEESRKTISEKTNELDRAAKEYTTSITELQNILKMKDDYIEPARADELQTEITELKLIVEEAKNTTLLKENEIIALQKNHDVAVEEYKTIIDALKTSLESKSNLVDPSEIENLTRKVEELNSQLEESRKTISEKTNELDGLNSKLDLAAKEYTTSITELKNILKMKDDYIEPARADELQMEITELKLIVEEAKNTTLLKENEIIALQKNHDVAVEEYKTIIDALKTSLESKSNLVDPSEIENLTRKVEELNSQLEESRKTISEKTNELDGLNSKLDLAAKEYTTSITELKNILKMKDDYIEPARADELQMEITELKLIVEEAKNTTLLKENEIIALQKNHDVAVEEYKTIIDALKTSLESKSNLVDPSEIENLTRKVEELNSQLEESRKTISEKTNELDGLNSKLDLAAKEYTNSITELQNILKMKDDYIEPARADELQTEITELKLIVEEAKNTTLLKENEIIALQKNHDVAVEEYKTIIDALKTSLESKSNLVDPSEIENLTRKVEDLNSQLEESRKTISEKTNELDGLNSKLDLAAKEYTNSITELQNILKMKDDYIEPARADELQTEITELKLIVEEAKNTTLLKENEIIALQKNHDVAVEEYKTIIDALKTSLESKSNLVDPSEIENLTRKVEELNSQLEESRKTISERTNELDGLNSKLDLAAKEYTTSITELKNILKMKDDYIEPARADELQMEITELKLIVEEAKNTTLLKENEIIALQKNHDVAVEEYKTIIDALKTSLESKSNLVDPSEIENLTRKVEELNSQLEESRKTISEKTNELDGLNSKLDLAAKEYTTSITELKNILKMKDDYIEPARADELQMEITELKLIVEEAKNTTLLKENEIIALQKNHDVAVEEYKTIIDALKTSLESKSNLVDPSEIENLTRKVEELNSQLEESRKTISEKTNELDGLNSKLDLAAKEYTNSITELQNILKMKDDYIEPARADELQTEITELKLIVEEAKNTTLLKENEIIALQKNHDVAVEEYKTIIDALKTSLESKSNIVDPSENENLLRKVEELNFQLEESRKTISEKVNELDGLNSKLDLAAKEYTTSITELQNILKMKHDYIEPARADELQTEITELKLIVEEAKNTTLLKENEIIALQKNHDVAVEEYKTIIDALKTSLESKSNLVDPSEIENLTRKVEELNSQLEESRKTISERTNELDGLNSKLDLAAKEYTTSITELKNILKMKDDYIEPARADELQTEITELKLIIEEAKNTTLLKENEIIALQKNHDMAVEEYKTIIDALKSSLESKSNIVDPSENENLLRKVEELNFQLEESRKTISEKVNELGELNSKLDLAAKEYTTSITELQNILKMKDDYIEPARADELQTEITELKLIVEEAKNTTLLKENEINTLKKEVGNLILDVEDLASKLKECRNHICDKKFIDLNYPHINPMDKVCLHFISDLQNVKTKDNNIGNAIADNSLTEEHNLKLEDISLLKNMTNPFENGEYDSDVCDLATSQKIKAINDEFFKSFYEVYRELVEDEKEWFGETENSNFLDDYDIYPLEQLQSHQSVIFNKIKCFIKAVKRNVLELQEENNKIISEFNALEELNNNLVIQNMDYKRKLEAKSEELHNNYVRIEVLHNISHQTEFLREELMKCREILFNIDDENLYISESATDLDSECNSALENTICELKKMLDQNQNDIIEYAQQIEANQKHIKMLKCSNASLLLENEALQKLFIKQSEESNSQVHFGDRSHAKDLEYRITELKQEVLQFNDFVLYIENVISSMEQDYCSSLEEKHSIIAFLKTKLIEMESLYVEKKRTNSIHNCDVVKQNEKYLHEVISEVQELERQISELTNEISQFKDVEAMKNDEIMNLTSSPSAMKDEYTETIDGLQAELDSRKQFVEPTIVDALKKEIIDLTAEISTYKDLVVHKENELKSLVSSQKDIEGSFTSKIDSLQAELDLRIEYVEPSVVEELKRQINELTSEISKFKDFEAMKNDEIINLTSSLSAMKVEYSDAIDGLQAELDSCKQYVEPTIVDALKKEIIDLTAEISTYKDLVVHRDNEIKSLVSSQKDIEGSFTSKIDSLQSELDLRIKYVEPSVVQELERQISELTNEISQFKDVEAMKNDEIMNLTSSLSAMKDEYTETIDGLQAELDSRKQFVEPTIVEALKKEIIDLTAEISTYKDLVTAKENEINSLVSSQKDIEGSFTSKIDSLQSELDLRIKYVEPSVVEELKRQINELTNEISKFKDFEAMKNDEIINLTSSLSAMKVEYSDAIDGLQAELDSCKQYVEPTIVDALKKEIIDLTAEISTYKDLVVHKENELKSLVSSQKDIEGSFTSKIDSLQAELDLRIKYVEPSVVEELKRQINELTNEISKFKDFEAMKNDEIINLTSSLSSMKVEYSDAIDGLQAELDSCKQYVEPTIVDALKKEIIDLTAEISTYKDLVVHKENELKSLVSSQTDIEGSFTSKIDSLQAELDLRIKYVEPSVVRELERQISELTNEISQFKDFEAMKNDEIINLTSSLSAMKVEYSDAIDGLQAELDSCKQYVEPTIVDALKKEIIDLTAEISTYKDLVVHKENELKSLVSSQKDIEGSFTSKIDSLQAELDLRIKYVEPSVVEELKRQINELTNEISKFKDFEAMKNDEIINLTSSLSSMKVEYSDAIDGLQAELDSCKQYVEPTIVDALKKEIIDLTAEISTYKDLVVHKENELKSLVSSQTDIEGSFTSKIDSLQAELDLRIKYVEPSVVRELERQISELTNEISQFKDFEAMKNDEIINLTSSLSAMKVEYSDAIDGLQAELDSCKQYVEPTIVDALKKEIIDLTAEISTYKDLVVHKENELKSLVSSQKDIQGSFTSKIDSLQAELDLRIKYVEPSVVEELKRQINELTNEISKFKDFEAMKNDEIINLTSSLSSMKVEYSDAIDGLQAELDSCKQYVEPTIVDALKKEIIDLTAEISTYKDLVVHKENELKSLVSSQTDIEGSFTSKIDSLQAELDLRIKYVEPSVVRELERQISELTNEISQFKDFEAMKNDEIINLTSSLSAMKVEYSDAIDGLQAELDSCKQYVEPTIVDALKKEIIDLTAEISTYKDLVVHKENELKSLVSSQKDIEGSFTSKIDSLQAELDLRIKYVEPSVVEELKRQINELTNEISKFKDFEAMKNDEIINLTSSLSSMKVEYSDAIDGLQAELDSCKQYVEPTIVDALKKEIIDLTAEISTYKDLVVHKENELKSLVSSQTDIEGSFTSKIDSLQAELDLRIKYVEPSVVEELKRQINELTSEISKFKDFEAMKNDEIINLTSSLSAMKDEYTENIDGLQAELDSRKQFVEPTIVDALKKEIIDLTAEISTYKDLMAVKEGEVRNLTSTITEIGEEYTNKLDKLQAELDLRIHYTEPAIVQELKKQIDALTNKLSHYKDFEILRDEEINLSSFINTTDKARENELNQNSTCYIGTLEGLNSKEASSNSQSYSEFKVPYVPLKSFSNNRLMKQDSSIQAKCNSTQEIIFDCSIANSSRCIESVNVSTLQNITIDETDLNNETMLNNSQLYMDVNGTCNEIDPFMSVCYKDSSFIDATYVKDDYGDSLKEENIFTAVEKIHSDDDITSILDENNYLKSIIVTLATVLKTPVTNEELNNSLKTLGYQLFMKVKSVISEIEKSKTMALNLVSTETDSDLSHLISTLCTRVIEQEETISNIISRTNELKSKYILLSKVSNDIQMLKTMKDELICEVKSSKLNLDLPSLKDKINEELKSVFLSNEKLVAEINVLKCKVKSSEEEKARTIIQCSSFKQELDCLKQDNTVLSQAHSRLEAEYNSDLTKLHYHETKMNEISTLIKLPSETFWEGLKKHLENASNAENNIRQNLAKEFLNEIECLKLEVKEKKELNDVLISEKNNLVTDITMYSNNLRDSHNKNCALIKLVDVIQNIIVKCFSNEYFNSQNIEKYFVDLGYSTLLNKLITLVQEFVNVKVILNDHIPECGENFSKTISSLISKLKEQEQTKSDYQNCIVKLKSCDKILTYSSELKSTQGLLSLEMANFKNQFISLFSAIGKELCRYKMCYETENEALKEALDCEKSAVENIKFKLSEAIKECIALKNVNKDYEKSLLDYSALKSDYNVMLENWTNIGERFKKLFTTSHENSTLASTYEKMDKFLNDYDSFRREFDDIDCPFAAIKEYRHELNALRRLLDLEVKSSLNCNDWDVMKDCIRKVKNLPVGSGQYSDSSKICFLEGKILALESELLDVDAFKRGFAKELHDLDPESKVFDLMELSLNELRRKMFDVIMEKEGVLISNIEKDYESKIANNLDRINQLQDQEKKRQVWVKEIESENEKLSAECKSLQIENDNLKAEIFGKIDEIKASSEKLNSLKTKLHSVPIDIWNEVSVIKDCTSLEEKLTDAIKDRNNILSEKLKDEEKLKSYEETVYKLNLELNEKSRNNESLTKMLAGKDYTIESMKMQIEHLSSEKVKLVNKIDSISYSLISLQKDHEVMKKTLQEKSEVYLQLKNQSADFDNMKKELEKQLNEKQVEIEELEAKCRQINNQAIDRYVLEKQELENEISTKNKIIGDLELKVHKWLELKAENDKLVSEKAGLETALSDMERKVKDLGSQIQSAEKFRKESSKACELLQNKVSENDLLITDLKSQIKIHIETNVTEKLKFEQTLEVKKLDISNLEATISSLKYEMNTIASTKEKYELLVKELQECRSQKLELENRIDDQEKQFSVERKRLEEVMNSKIAKVHELEMKINVSKSKYNESMKLKNETCHILERNLLNMQNQVRTLQEELQKQNQILNVEKFKYEDELKKNMTSIKELQESLDRLKLKNVESFGIHFLQQRLFELFSNPPESVDVALQQIKDNFDRLELISEQLAEEKEKCGQLDDECEMMNDKIKYLEEELTEAYNIIEQTEKKYTIISKEVDSEKELQNNIILKEQELRQFEKLIVKLETEITEINRKYAKSQESEKELKNKLKYFEEEFENKQIIKECNQCEELAKAIECYKSDIVMQNSKITDLELKIVTWNHSYKNEAEIANEYRKKASQLKEEVMKLKEKPIVESCAKCKLNQLSSESSPGNFQGSQMQAQPSSGTQNRKIAVLEEKISKLEKDRAILKRLCQNRSDTIKELQTKLQLKSSP